MYFAKSRSRPCTFRPSVPGFLATDVLRRSPTELLACDGALRPAEDPLRAADREERPARGDSGRARGMRPHLGRHVDGRPAGCLQPVDLVVKVGPGGYDRFASGIRARAHSIVSFVVSMVRVGQ